MTQSKSGRDDEQAAAGVLSAMVDLVSAWSSLEVQARITRRIGLDVNESDTRTLHTLGRLGGAARPAQLADELHLTRPTMSKSLSRLSLTGFIERRPADGDGRATEISLTETGQQAYQDLVAAGVEMVQAALKDTPGVDTDAVIRFTRALRATV